MDLERCDAQSVWCCQPVETGEDLRLPREVDGRHLDGVAADDWRRDGGLQMCSWDALPGTHRVWNGGAKNRGADVPGSSRHVNRVMKRQRKFNLFRVPRMYLRSTRVRFRHRLTPPLEVVNKEPPRLSWPTDLDSAQVKISAESYVVDLT